MNEYSYIIKYLSYLWNNAFLILLSTEAIKEAFLAYLIGKGYDIKDISKVYTPKLKLNNKNIKLRNDISCKSKAEINKFIDVIIKNFDISVLKNFYNNISELLVIDNVGSYHSIYDCEYNTIKYNNLPVIYHELFHMSSTYFVNNKNCLLCYSGFCFVEYKDFKTFSIGNGLNEGYTDLMTERYFEEEYRKFIHPYWLEKNIASHLEIIVGKSLMEKLYLTSNLKGLINELNKYKSNVEIAEFLTKFDFVCKYLRIICWSDGIKKRKIELYLKSIYKFLIDTYVIKLKEELNKNIITADDFINLAFEYIKSFDNYFVFNGTNYQIFSKDDINKIFDDLYDYITNYCSKKDTIYVLKKDLEHK